MIKLFFILIVLLFARIISPCQTPTGEDDKSKYETAVENYNQAKYSLVITYCNDLLDIGTGDPDVYKLRGMAKKAIGDYANAAFDFKEALKGRRDPNVYYERGLVLMCLRKFKEAEFDFSQASRLYKQQSPGGIDFFQHQEESGRASHYTENYRLAISSFTDAIQNGSTLAYIDLMSSLYQNSNLNELKFYSDSLLKASDFIPLSNKTFYNYISALNDIASAEITETTLEKINNALKNFQPPANKCFQGFYNDLLYARAGILDELGKDTLAYRQYKQLYAANEALKEVRKKVDGLKKDLNMDAIAPEITIVNPIMNEHNSATIPATRGSYEIYVQVKDSSGIASVTLDSKPVSRWDDDGIFIRQVELNPGRNDIVITATDKEENSISKTFIINFEEKQSQVIDTAMDADIPEISTETKYHALLIAEKDYADNGFNDLANPINDATELKDLLIRDYEFDEENVHLITNASRSAILDSLEKISKPLTDMDNLLIFYAGHGDVRRVNKNIEGGFIIPSDATKGDRATYISNETFLAPVKSSKARHILFVLDACFGGAFASRSISMDDASKDIKNLYKLKSRRILTSGNLEEVPDLGNFISRLKEYFRKQKEKYSPAIDLYRFIRKNIVTNTNPQFDKIPNCGDVGGEFIFVRRDENKEVIK